jgi:two-component system OmpR family sensor kinase
MTDQSTGSPLSPRAFQPDDLPPTIGDPSDPNVLFLAADELDSPPPLVDGEQPLDAIEASDNAHRTGGRRWRVVPRSLSSRLVAGVVVLVLLVVALAGAATYVALGRFLDNRLNQQLSALADNNVPAAVRCVRVAPASCQLGTGPQTTPTSGQSVRSAQQIWLTILDPQAAQLSMESTSMDLTIMSLTSDQRSAIAANPTSVRTLTTTGGAVLRVTGRPVQTSGGTFYEVIGLSLAEETNTLHRLILIELAIGAGAVLLAFFATTVGVRLSLRPLHRVTTTAREVTAELSPEGAGLDRRVPVTEGENDTEVGQLATSVNTLLGAVETHFAARLESEQRMRQFMADASHELRTPLTSIRGYAELARMRRALDPDRDASAPDSDADALDRIESEGTRMSRLVEDLLTLARGDIGAPIQTEPIEVSELIEDAVEGAQAAHPRRRFGVTARPGVIVHGDHDQLLRVIRNLVTNAAVHTAPGRPIRVTAAREGDQVLIRVIDSGPGLTPEQAAHVFERFWRSDSSRARTSGGSGLGLAIVASIVAAHGGTVRFDSSVEGGSTVTVSLPAR